LVAGVITQSHAMLGISYILNNVQAVKKACRDKQLDETIVDHLLEIDIQRRQLKAQVDQIRWQMNQNADEIKIQVHQDKKPSQDLVEKGKRLKDEIKQIEPKFKEVMAQYEQLMLTIPNVPAPEVPIGTNELGNQMVRQVGTKPQFSFELRSHDVIMEKLGWLDTKRAVRIGGFRSYFLQGKAVLLEQALLRYALDLMIKHDFTPMTVPVLVNREAMTGTGYFPWGKEDHYFTQDDQILAGTAEVALTSYYLGETLTEDQLPIKLVGISPCFRREIGAHGQDTKGVIRVHQFNKVEQVVLTVADETITQEWHEKMVGYAEELLQSLALPYQVLLMCTGDMGAGQRKKYDIETWFPFQEKYRETHSASYFNDFQTRRLGIKYQAKDGTTKFAYSLNNTVAATPRLLAALIENNQQADGTVKVPAVLQKYL
jgi:seryl-tRNA synthetase